MQTQEYSIHAPFITDRSVQQKIISWTDDLLPVEDTPKLRHDIKQWGLPWFRAGALVRNHEGKFLMIHEGRVQIKKIKDEALKAGLLQKIKEEEPENQHPENKWVDGDGGWNIPAGRLNPGESFEYAAEREVMEESDCAICLENFLYLRVSDKSSNLFVMPVFGAYVLHAPASFHSKEVMEIAWLSADDIRVLHQKGELRSPKSVMGALEAYERR